MKFIYASSLLFLATFSQSAPLATDLVLVTINGVPVRQSEVVERLLKRYGAQTVDEMIDETLLRQSAKKNSILGDEKEVERRLGKLQEQFGSRELFISQLEQAGSSLTKVKDDLAEQIMREKLIVKMKRLTVTEDEVKKAFSENKDKLATPESIHLRHILVPTAAKADAIVSKIKAGADFKALAKEESLAASGKAAGGDYGYVSRGMLPPEIDEIAFAMKSGEIKTIPGPRGQHVLQVLDKKPSKPAVYNDVKSDLREMLMSEKIKAAAPEFLQELRTKADIKTGETKTPPTSK